MTKDEYLDLLSEIDLLIERYRSAAHAKDPDPLTLINLHKRLSKRHRQALDFLAGDQVGPHDMSDHSATRP